MPLPVTISASVGKYGKNKYGDVLQVQSLLNKFISAGCLKPLNQLVMDGLVGPKTIGAIMAFQKGILNFTKIDGKVDPGGLTINGLNGPLKWATPGAGGEEASMDWAIALSAIKQGFVEFSLVNMATSMAQKIIVRNQNIRPVVVNKSYERNYIMFAVPIPLGFQDFANTQMRIAQTVAVPYPLIARIGWIGSIPLTTVPAKSMQQICPSVNLGVASGLPFAKSILGCDVPDSNSLALGTVTLFDQVPVPIPKPYPNIASAVLILSP